MSGRNERIRLRRPSPAMVVAVIALIVALGGTALAEPLAELAKRVSGDKLIKKGSLSGNRLRKGTLTGTQINLAKLGTVPKASHANNADFANSAGSANSASSANTANNASDAAKLGGTVATEYQRRCQPGTVAAVARWYMPGLPTDGTYVPPNRYGGEDGFACAGSGLTATLASTGRVLVKVNGLSTQGLFPLAQADAYTSAPLFGYASGPFAGDVYDVRTFDKTGAVANSYYLLLTLMQTR